MKCSWPHCDEEATIPFDLLAYCDEHWADVQDNRETSRG